MPPKAAEKKPTTAGKAPAGKAPEKKEAGKKTAAASGEKKEAHQDQKGDLLLIHLQGFEAGPSRHWHFQPCYVYPQLLRQ